MKRWVSESVPVHIVPGNAVMLARTTNCIGRRFNKVKGYWVHVYSRDETPLTDAMLGSYVDRNVSRENLRAVSTSAIDEHGHVTEMSH